MSQIVKGQVVEVDRTGNLITDIPSGRLSAAPKDSTLRVTVDEFETFGLFGPDHSEPSMTLIAVSEEGKSLRLVLVDDSASDMLGVQVGAPVQIQW